MPDQLMRRRSVIAGAAALLLAACGKKESAPNAAGEKFLEDNLKNPGVKSTPSGLQYRVVRANPGKPKPGKGDEVKVNYEGTLIDGTVFDSSYSSGQPVIFKLDSLIPAWIEAIPMMSVGEEWLLFVPPKLGYGDRATPSIPANSVLVFRIELIAFLPTGNQGLA